MTSPSGLAGNMDAVAGTSIGCERFEFILLLLMAADVAVSEAAVLVIAWYMWEDPVLYGKEGYPTTLARMEVKNAGLSG